MTAQKNSGFAAIEGLLILIIFAVIGGVGWYVIHTKHQTDKILSQANKISLQVPVKKTGQQRYFTIKEWGVKGPESASFRLQYKIVNFAGIPEAEFTSTELLKAGGSDCEARGGTISQYDGADSTGLNTINPNETVEQAAQNGHITYYALVNDKYYVYHSPQSACADPKKIQTLQTDTNGAVRALTEGLRAI
jgi:hypothetical protein